MRSSGWIAAGLLSWGALSLIACGEDSQTTTATSTSAASSGAGGEAGATSASSSAGGGEQGGMGGAGAQGGGGSGGGGMLTVQECYQDDYVTPLVNGPDYDQFGPVVGSHCMGTNHQDITGVERVVFLGDSITVGTPPTQANHFYRSQLADALAAKFGLNTPNVLWKNVNPFEGTSGLQEDGAFASCSKWGARTDDFAPTQLPDCFPQNRLSERTLVIITMGGNDVSNLAKDAIDGETMENLWTSTMDFVQLHRDAVEWLVTPGRFPNGVYVVFANAYEFTDGTGEVQSCDVSALAGFDEPVPNPAELSQMVIWANEQYVKLAVDTGTDIIFLLEDFCGHGFENDNPQAPCYRGPNTPRWFDLTCTHPNPAGHDHITDMFMAVVDE